jgi:4-amino-4-deoxy-L-arabinose transferase-like glycosyltransferase
MDVIKKETLWFIIASIGAFYWCLSSYALLNNNEGLYAQIAYEMLSNKDFVIPTLNGVPYIEKPPMLYWLVSLSYTLFGKSVLAARLVPATFGFLTCLALVVFGRALGREPQGFLAGTLLASSLGFAIFSRMVFFDGLLTAFFTFALLSFYLWDQRKERKWLRLFYGFLACAVLTKGLLSLCLAGLICGTFLIVKYRSFSKIWALWDTVGVVLFLFIALPWHILAHLQQPDFSWFYFINEHVMRFLDKREPRDYYQGPFYYYLLRIPAYFMPWTLLLPFVGKSLSKQSSDKNLRLFLCLWALLILLFFSMSQAKANYYMMLGMPPLALLFVDYCGNRTRFGLLSKIAVVFSFCAIGVAAYLAPSHNQEISAIDGAAFLKKQTETESIYLYKRFEHLSSLIFYYGKPLPLADSESADLAFGQKTPQALGRFFEFNKLVEDPSPKLFIVHKRDIEEFEGRCGTTHSLVYSDKGLNIYLWEGKL